jgi:ribosomal protein L37AE/L43A
LSSITLEFKLKSFFTIIPHARRPVYDLRDEEIRDRLVVGIREARHSERLQLDPDLTLAKAVKAVRQFEQVRQQQGFLHGAAFSEKTGDHTATQYSTKTPSAKYPEQMKQADTVQQQQQQRHKKCKWCGNHRHDRSSCPAKIFTCSSCFKLGHYKGVCLSKNKSVKSVQTVSLDQQLADSLFLDTVSNSRQTESDCWQIEVMVSN